MQIFWTDGYAREIVSERLVASNIKNEREAKIMVDALQAAVAHESDWYRLAEDEEQPYEFDPR